MRYEIINRNGAKLESFGSIGTTKEFLPDYPSAFAIIDTRGGRTVWTRQQ